MNPYFLTLIFVVLAIETSRYFKLSATIKDLYKITKKLINFFKFQNVSPHWKEICLIRYSALIFMKSIKLIFFFSFIGMIFFLISKYDKGFHNFVFSIYGLVISIIIIIIYNKVRKFFEQL